MAKIMADQQVESIGFKGLDLLVSNVEGDIRDAKRTAARVASATGSAPQPEAESPARAGAANGSTAQPTGDVGSAVGWWVTAVAVVLFVWIWGASQNDDERPPPAPAPTGPNSTSMPESPTVSATIESPAGSVYRPDAARPAGTRASVDSSPNWVESRPPVATGRVLNLYELRYCVAEDIRIDAMGQAVDNHSEREVDTFNEAVSDFNERCASARYRDSTMSSVQRETRARKAIFEEIGRERVGDVRAEQQ